MPGPADPGFRGVTRNQRLRKAPSRRKKIDGTGCERYPEPLRGRLEFAFAERNQPAGNKILVFSRLGIAQIANLIPVDIRLVGVGHVRAVIGIVRNQVEVRIRFDRAYVR